MKKIVKISIIILVVLILEFIFVASGLHNATIGQPINKLVSGAPDKTCNFDSECVLKKTTCHACDCWDVVNHEWNRFCPGPGVTGGQHCGICASLASFDIKCIDNQCQKTWKILD